MFQHVRTSFRKLTSQQKEQQFTRPERNGFSRRESLVSLIPATALVLLTVSSHTYAQLADFNVTVNTGAAAPNNDTVYPGEATSMRISLTNSSLVSSITGVNFNKDLPNTAANGLRVNGASAISGDPGCVLGTLTTTPGSSSIVLAGLTIPQRQAGVPGSGECYLDIPIVAYSTDGNSTSLSYSLDALEVDSDQGSNATGGPQAYTLRSSRRPTWSKSFDSGGIHVVGSDSDVTMTITVRNNDNNVPLTGITFTDIFPTANTVDGFLEALIEPTGEAAGGTCGADVALTQGVNADAIVSNLSLAPNTSCTITIKTQARHSSTVFDSAATNSIPAAGFVSDQGLRPSSDATANFQAQSPIAVSKEFTPDIVASGESNTFVITLTNNSGADIPVVNFVDDPIAANPNEARLTIAGAPGDIDNSCGGNFALRNGGVVVPAGPASGFSVDGFDIPANGTCEITVTYTGTTPGADTPSTYTNDIPEGAVDTGINSINSQEVSATVLVADRLRVVKSQSPSVATPGDPVRYTIEVENYSAAIINNVTVEDVLQNGSTLLLNAPFAPTLSAGCGALTTNGAEGDSDVDFIIGMIPARSAGSNDPGSCSISFSVMIDPDANGNTTNEIAAGAVCFGGGTCNAVGSGPSNTTNVDTLVLNKTFDNVENLNKNEGATARLRLRLDNNAVTALSSLTISDTLPFAGPLQQLRIANPANISNTCGGTVTAAAGSTSVALNGGSIAARVGGTPGRCELALDVVGPPGVYNNTANTAAVRNNADGTNSNVVDSDSATITYSDALEAAKSFSPATTGDGGSSTATIRLTSVDPNRPITGIALSDDLPPGMVVATPANAYTTCNGTTTLQANPGDTTVSLSGVILAPETSCDLIFDVNVTGNSDWTNTIPAGGITADNGITIRSPVSAVLGFVAPDTPLISKAIAPGVIAPGQSALLTINITNGVQALTGVTVDDYFTVDGTPGAANNGIRIAAAPEASTTCPSGIVTAVPGSNSVRMEGADLAGGEACSISVRITSTTAGTATNTIPLNSIESDQGATNSTSFAQSTLSTTSDAGVSKMFEPPVVSPGETSRLRITIYNAQENALTDLALTDAFPAGLSLAADPAAVTDCGGSATITFPDPTTLQLSNGSIGGANGNEAATCVIEVNVVSPAEGTFVNTIPADSLTTAGNPVPHPEAESTLQVRERLIVNKAFDNLTLDAGDPVGFTTGTASRLPGETAPLTIRIENPNALALTEVSVADLLPDGLVLATTPNVTTNCTDGIASGDPSGRELRLTGATLAARGSAGAICRVTANVVSNIPGLYTNEIAVGDVTSLEGIGNDPGTQAQIIFVNPPTVGKDIAPPVVAPGVPATLTLTLGNDNDLPTTLTANLVDDLPRAPDQMRVANPSVISTDCPGGAGIVTANADADRITIASGSSIPAGGCVVTVDIVADTVGEYVNVIPVGAMSTGFGVNDEPAEANLNVSTRGYISGRVFLDNQPVPDGTYLPGSSTPIDGNTIELRAGGTCSGALLATTTTDGMGNYLFSDLAAGTYSVCQPTQPADTLNSVTTEGTIETVGGSTGTAGTASNPPGGSPTSQITGIVLNNTGDPDEVSGSPENNFSEILPASISGNVYHDANNDGNFDGGENGLGGVTITLTGPVTVSVTTNPDGSYSFEGLPPGEYTITQTQPGAWNDGIDTLGNVDGVAVGDDSVNDTFSVITLAPGDAGVEYNFGEILDVASLAVQANAFCSNDAPGINYSLPAFAGGDGPNVTVSLLTTDDRLVGLFEDQPSSGSVLWPGVVVDGSGQGVGWPGWALVNGSWVAQPDDRLPDLVVRVSIDGDSEETTVTYPAFSQACRTQPPGTEPRNIPAIPGPALLMLLMMTILSAGWGLRQQR